MESDSDYTLVQSRHLKRKLRRTSAGSDSTHKSRCDERVFSVGYTPTTAGTNLNSLNRQSLTNFFDRIASGHVREIRINARKNILTVDVSSQAVLEALKSIEVVGNIPVRSFLAYGNDTCTGVVSDVDIDIKDEDLRSLLSSTVRILDIHRFGRSRCIKLVFESDSLPASIKVGYVRHSVRPYVPRPLQCHKCFKLGHVSAVCKSPTSCRRCGGAHQVDSCETDAMKCANCSGAHEATSKDCPKMAEERQILRKMVRENSTHKEAANSVRKKRRRLRQRRRRSQSKSREKESLPLSTWMQNVPQREQGRQTQAAPPPVPPRPSRNEASSNVRPTSSAVAWPSLPQRASGGDTPSVLPKSREGNERLENEKMIDMLKQLVNTMRILISGLATPTALSVVKALDAMEPLLAALK